MDAGRAEEQRVNVTKGVPAVKTSVIHYGGGDNLLSKLQGLGSQALDEVGEEYVDFLQVFHCLQLGQVSLSS